MPLVDIIVGGTKSEIVKVIKARGYTGNRYKVAYTKRPSKVGAGHFWTAEVMVLPAGYRYGASRR